MHELLIGIWQTKPHRLAIILITHDVAEAISLARPSDALARAGYVVAGNNVGDPASIVRQDAVGTLTGAAAGASAVSALSISSIVRPRVSMPKNKTPKRPMKDQTAK